MAESAHYLYGQDHLQHGYSDTYYDSALPQSSSLSMAAYYQPEQSQRKRPKYTRSKTGCMTCRQKKVKCDEEKPDCARCRAGGRDCVWPDGGTTRKRTTRRDTRASHSHSPSIDVTQAPTGGSASPSIASTPPSRLKAEPVDFPLPQATPHSVSTGLRYTTEVDHYKSHM
ncbi:hypothetical protein BC629DRAFT_937907 [Irpex lacteus]|nr:hypothetical protein BC629DRAFT_937907 [Irpex lacteus]